MMECNFCKCDIGPNMFASVGKIQIMEFYVNIKYPKCDKEVKRNHGIVTACGGCLIKIYQFFNLLCVLNTGITQNLIGSVRNNAISLPRMYQCNTGFLCDRCGACEECCPCDSEEVGECE